MKIIVTNKRCKIFASEKNVTCYLDSNWATLKNNLMNHFFTFELKDVDDQNLVMLANKLLRQDSKSTSMAWIYFNFMGMWKYRFGCQWKQRNKHTFPPKNWKMLGVKSKTTTMRIQKVIKNAWRKKECSVLITKLQMKKLKKTLNFVNLHSPMNEHAQLCHDSTRLL